MSAQEARPKAEADWLREFTQGECERPRTPALAERARQRELSPCAIRIPRKTEGRSRLAARY